MRNGHRLIERHAASLCLKPTDLNAATVRGWYVAECLRRIKTFALVPLQPGLLRLEVSAIERPGGILRIRSQQHPFAVLKVVVDRQLKEIRAFEEIAVLARIPPFDDARQRPLFQIRRRKEVDGVFSP